MNPFVGSLMVCNIPQVPQLMLTPPRGAVAKSVPRIARRHTEGSTHREKPPAACPNRRTRCPPLYPNEQPGGHPVVEVRPPIAAAARRFPLGGPPSPPAPPSPSSSAPPSASKAPPAPALPPHTRGHPLAVPLSVPLLMRHAFILITKNPAENTVNTVGWTNPFRRSFRCGCDSISSTPRVPAIPHRPLIPRGVLIPSHTSYHPVTSSPHILDPPYAEGSHRDWFPAKISFSLREMPFFSRPKGVSVCQGRGRLRVRDAHPGGLWRIPQPAPHPPPRPRRRDGHPPLWGGVFF